MSELPAGIPAWDPPEPRESASSIVLAARPGGGWEVLMGRRARKARFMPGHLAFPGGVIDPEDGEIAAGGYARCATRELNEETGIEVASEAWIDAGERVTPAMFPRRFRTRFFVATWPSGQVLPAELPSPEEIEAVERIAPGEVLERWEAGKAQLPPPMLPILRVLAEASGERSIEQVAADIAEANALEERAPRIEFVPGLWMVPLRSATLPPATHTNLWMPGGRRHVLIDPGPREPQEVERLVRVARRREQAGSQAEAILLTHHHQDHVDGAAAAAGRLGLPVVAHRTTLDLLERVGKLDATVDYRPAADDERIDLDGCVLRACHTPGHAPGHLVWLIEGEGQAIVGDLVSGLSTILIQPGEGDMGAYLESLERIRKLGLRRLFPGHGPPLPGRALDRLIDHRRDRERKVLAQLESGPAALAEIARGAYPELLEMPAALIEMQARAHLVDLEKRGEVNRVGNDDARWRRS